MLYRLSYRGISGAHPENCTHYIRFLFSFQVFFGHLGNSVPSMCLLCFWSSFRPISSSQLHASLHFHLCPIYLIVSKGSLTFLPGDLILRGASRLDAFSVYPSPSWLPSRAIGMTTGPPADGPSRSSRTKDSSSQISHARAG